MQKLQFYIQTKNELYDNNIWRFDKSFIVKMYKFLVLSLSLLLISPLFLNIDIGAESSHPNLFVSAENSLFENHFTGSMVVEVVIRDSEISDTDEAKGEPDVTINGKDLRMVQGSDGNWYAYFANVEKAKQADQIAFTGQAGESLDFGTFCNNNADLSGAGSASNPTFTDTEGVFVDGAPAGAPAACVFDEIQTGDVGNTDAGTVVNVVREPKSPNTTAPGLNVGQIDIDADAWPFIQLFSFSNDVTIIYNKGGGSQRVDLNYSDIPNISLNIDRNVYPKGAEVFVTVNDMQLNQDPTDEDSWTFKIDSPRTTFYQAFTESGSDSGNGGAGLVNLNPYLVSLGFEKNGNLGMNLGPVAILKTNQYQQSSFVTTGTINYNNIVTLVESEPNSGIFHSFDFSDQSVIGIKNDAPRGQSASIEYNSKTTSIVTGDSTATFSIGINSAQFNPGQKATITLVDNDQNFNPGVDEDLDIFRSSTIIPALQIGNPTTLANGITAAILGSTGFTSTAVQQFSDRAMLVLAGNEPVANGDVFSITFGTTQDLFDAAPINNPDFKGFALLNYDVRSLANPGNAQSITSVDIAVNGQLVGDNVPLQGKIILNNAFDDGLPLGDDDPTDPLKVDFTINTPTIETITTGTTLPVVVDFFGIGIIGDGLKTDERINNSIYRFELEETSANSGMFTGTIEYVVTNQLNQFDSNLIKSLRTFSNEIRFLINDELTDEDAINLAYSDIAKVGVPIGISAKTEIKSQTGSVTLESQSYRFGQPVVVILTDPDLNTKHDIIDTYNVVNDPSSDADDTVGDTSGNVLLEIRIKGFRYHRCNINGVEHGGLGSTGFSLVETGTDTGIFKGSFKMPSQICNEAGTQLISPAGGSIEASYFDFRDASGQPREIGLTFPKITNSQNQFKIETEPNISIEKIQMKDSFNRPILQKPIVGQKINFVTDISNNDQKSQSFSYIIQVKDENNKVVDLRWVDGTVDPTKKKTIEILWEPKISAKYTIEIFVWDGINSGIPLTSKTEYRLTVGSR